ncbi:MAG: chromosome partitioning protein ParA [Clostridia bacterium]|nr:chromosome partitioning protein ParA [Clostridia bacterium]
MKIKLAILERDQSYLNRIVSVFSTKYSDKFEIYSFTNPEVALSTLDNAKIDVLVANDAFDIDVTKLPKRCGFAYLVDSMDVETVNNQRAIAKFQKVDLIYKQILSIYSENAGSVSGLKLGDDSAKIIAFESVSGGCGGSTMAAACALHFAAQGKKTLYLNLEKFGSSDSFFSAEGQFDMSDIIFALKSKKANLALKLESCVKQDPRGVYFYSQSKIALDMLELSTDDVMRLINELKLTGSYNAIVLDLDFSIEKDALKVLRQMHSIIWVGDGSDISNTKLYRAYNALSTMEQNADSPLTNRLLLIYNKFSNKTSKTLEEIGVKNIGGCPRFEHATTAMVLGQVAPKDMFDKIV